MVLVNPKVRTLNCAMSFEFKATNNAAKYEAILASLRLAKDIQVKRLIINSDSQLVVSQIYSNFSTKD